MRPWTVALLLSACGPTIAQVPADQPHGIVQFRVVHDEPRNTYEDEARVDFETMELSMRKREPALRIRPGRHYAELISRRFAWEHSFEQVNLPRRTCGDVICTPAATTEVRSVMRPAEDEPVCQGEYDLDVKPGSRQLALLIVSKGGKECTSCLRDDLDAHHCK